MQRSDARNLWTSHRFKVLVGMCVLFVAFVAPAHALEVSLASIQGGQIHVVGKGAVGNASILWQGVQVGMATPGGTFDFTTEDVPEFCVGELTDGTETLFIAVNGCTASGIVSPGINAPVPVTGQITSYEQRDDGDVQAGVPFPDPRFTNNGDGTVTDHLTGLIWLRHANCFGPRGWADALFVTNNLAHGQCGLSDGSQAGAWRLPNVRELHSLVHFGRSGPAIPAGAPFTFVQSAFYWSSTSIVANPLALAWVVNFNLGGITTSNKFPLFGGEFVLPVRGGL